MVYGMTVEKTDTRKDLAIRIPMTAEQRQRFEDAMKRGHIIRGRWIADAIDEKLDRDKGPRDAA